MKEKIYLDTSIPSAYYDYSKPLRQLITQKWFEYEAKQYNLYISTLTMLEINNFSNVSRKKNILELIRAFRCHLLENSKEAEDLSKKYIKYGAIPEKELKDALHIAIATVSKIPLLASWNFSHIVSINPIRKINEINKKQNHSFIQIGSLEIFGGAKYGNL